MSEPFGEEWGEVRRDGHGIPHLWADSVTELARLQGGVTAHDRAWQVELQRLRVEGRTAEVLGAEGVDWDRFARQAVLADVARDSFEALDDETRAWVTAYVDGINEGLPQGLAKAPELDLLTPTSGSGHALRNGASNPERGTDPGSGHALRNGASNPERGTDPGSGPREPWEPWEPWIPLGIFLVEHVLASTFPHKLFREHVASSLGLEWLDLFTLEGAVTSGSNAWAVAPTRTATGGALVAADPHRLVELPGCYQQVQLACPEFDVVGLAFPGVPGVQHFAHTGGVAWAVTNAMADYQDLVVEHLTIEQLAPSQQHHLETIVVRGADDVTVPVLVTPRGPVVCGLDRALSARASAASPAAYSLVAPSHVTKNLGFGCFLPLLRARDVDDVEAALAGWVEPVNSVVVADTGGRVRHLVAGRVPRRDPLARELPIAATDPRHRWLDGWEPMPSRDIEVAVAANDRDAALGLAHRPVAPHRARRIRELLGRREHLTVDDLATIQTDTYLPTAVLVTERLAALDVQGDAALVRDRIVAWDGWMDGDSEGAATFAQWRHEFVRWVSGHPQLAPLHRLTGHDAIYAPWLDVTAAIGHAWEAFVREGERVGLDIEGGMRSALTAVAGRAGWDAEPWGERHLLRPLHALAPVVGHDPMVEVSLSGDADCLWASSSVPGHTDGCHRAPVARVVWDLADRDNSRWIVPFGASGRCGDPHFDDQLDLWSRGELVGVQSAWPRVPRLPTPGAAGDRYGRVVPALGAFGVRPLDIAQDIAEVHRWVDDPRARFWGMVGKTVDEVADIYAFLESLETHHAWTITVDDRPAALIQTYDPAHDPVSDCYPVQAGDLGVHLLLAPPTDAAAVSGYSGRLIGAVIGWLFSFDVVQRLVVEPDRRNDAAVGRLQRLGFELGPTVQLPDKVGQLAFLTRPAASRVVRIEEAPKVP